MKTKRPEYVMCFIPEDPRTYVSYNGGNFRHLNATLCIIEDKRPRWFDFSIKLTAQAGGGDDMRDHKFYAFHTAIDCRDACANDHIGDYFCKPYDEMHKIIAKWNKRDHYRINSWAEFVAAFMETIGIKTLIYDLDRTSTWDNHTYQTATGMRVMQVLMQIEATTLDQLYQHPNGQPGSELSVSASSFVSPLAGQGGRLDE